MKIAKTAIISTLLFTFNAKAIDLNVNDVTQINMSGEVNQAITYNNWSCVYVMAEPSYKKSKGSNADFMACTDKKIKASKLKNKLVDITGEIVAINYSTQNNNLAPYPIVKIDKIELVNIEHHHSGNPTESGGFGRSGGFRARGKFR